MNPFNFKYWKTWKKGMVGIGIVLTLFIISYYYYYILPQPQPKGITAGLMFLDANKNPINRMNYKMEIVNDVPGVVFIKGYASIENQYPVSIYLGMLPSILCKSKEKPYLPPIELVWEKWNAWYNCSTIEGNTICEIQYPIITPLETQIYYTTEFDIVKYAQPSYLKYGEETIFTCELKIQPAYIPSCNTLPSWNDYLNAFMKWNFNGYKECGIDPRLDQVQGCYYGTKNPDINESYQGDILQFSVAYGPLNETNKGIIGVIDTVIRPEGQKCSNIMETPERPFYTEIDGIKIFKDTFWGIYWWCDPTDRFILFTNNDYLINMYVNKMCFPPTALTPAISTFDFKLKKDSLTGQLVISGGLQ